MVATAKAGSTTGSSCIRSSSWTHWSKPKCRVVGPSVEIHQGMVMDGAFMAEKMAVFLAMASMASMGKIMENLHIPRWQLIDWSLCGRCVLPFPIWRGSLNILNSINSLVTEMDAAWPRFRGAETAVFARHGGQQVQLDASWLGGQGESCQIFWISSISCIQLYLCELCGILQWINWLIKHESPWVYQSVHHQHIIFHFHMETSLEIPTVPFPNSGCCCRPSWALL